MTTRRSDEHERVRRFGRQLWWGFVLSVLMFAYLLGIALVAGLTHLLSVLLEAVGVPDDAVRLARFVAWGVEAATGLLLAVEAIVSEYRGTKARLRGQP